MAGGSTLVVGEDGSDVRSADCRRHYVMLIEGGVRVRWDCGAELVDDTDVEADMALLEDRFQFTPHHHRRRKPPG